MVSFQHPVDRVPIQEEQHWHCFCGLINVLVSQWGNSGNCLNLGIIAALLPINETEWSRVNSIHGKKMQLRAESFIRTWSPLWSTSGFSSLSCFHVWKRRMSLSLWPAPAFLKVQFFYFRNQADVAFPVITWDTILNFTSMSGIPHHETDLRQEVV